MNITHDMSIDLTEYDPESRQVDGPNPIENRISSSAARVPDIISCTSGITVQGRQLHSFAFTTDAAIIRNTNTRSGDYENLKEVPRPGHADYTAQV